MWMRERKKSAHPFIDLKIRIVFTTITLSTLLTEISRPIISILCSCSFRSFMKTNLTLPNRLKLNDIVCCRLTKSKKKKVWIVVCETKQEGSNQSDQANEILSSKKNKSRFKIMISNKRFIYQDQLFSEEIIEFRYFVLIQIQRKLSFLLESPEQVWNVIK